MINEVGKLYRSKYYPEEYWMVVDVILSAMGRPTLKLQLTNDSARFGGAFSGRMQVLKHRIHLEYEEI